jgi:hypothetical protein
MDASQLIHRNRNQMIFAWYWDNNLFGDKIRSSSGFDIQIQRVEGADPSLERAASSNTQTPYYPIDSIVLSALDSVLDSVASNNRGPTRTARISYLWFLTVSSAYNWVQSSGPISGIKDSWNWDTRHPPTGGNKDVLLWMVAALEYSMPSFVPGYSAASIKQTASNALEWTADTLNSQISRVQTESRWSDWTSAWDTWYSGRANDGSVAAAAVPPDSALPNGNQTLEVTTDTDDPNNFTDPQKWVPLKISGSKKNYLTFGWGDVTSTGLSSSQETSILETTQSYFPGTASSYNDGSERANEIAEVVNITGNLTDTQKMIAEFWAGGPFTVSPPGMFVWFWRYYMDATQTAKSFGLNQFFYSGLDLAIHLFETSRLVWQSKKDNFQARPIQEIRRMYRGQTLTKYDGTPIAGEAWVPYQETNFVTPPFPDFPSGHSAFSQSFANTMKDWFGDLIVDNKIPINTFRLISPMFTQSQENPFGTFLIPVGVSDIESESIPRTLLKFTYPTWQAMADEAGVSRKYGGIHATSAHTSSQALANALHPAIASVWNISRS